MNREFITADHPDFQNNPAAQKALAALSQAKPQTLTHARSIEPAPNEVYTFSESARNFPKVLPRGPMTVVVPQGFSWIVTREGDGSIVPAGARVDLEPDERIFVARPEDATSSPA